MGAYSSNDLAACGIDEHHLESLSTCNELMGVDGVACERFEASLRIAEEAVSTTSIRVGLNQA